MTRLDIVDGVLRVEVLGWDKLWAFKSRLELPLEHVVSVQRWEPEMKKRFYGLRAPGTALPGVIVAGTYHQLVDGKWRHNFFDVHSFERAIVIELENDWYHHVIVEVENVEEVLRVLDRVRVGVG